MKIYLHRKLNALYPADQVSHQMLLKLAQDETYKATIIKPRNPGHHRKLFALLSLVFENLPHELEAHFKSTDDLLFEIKLQAGYREKYVSLGGQEFYRVKSIAFDKMDQTEFEDFYEKALHVITKYILPNITEEELINQLLEF